MALACRSLGIEFITGAELTAELDGDRLHILGYYLDMENPKICKPNSSSSRSVAPKPHP